MIELVAFRIEDDLVGAVEGRDDGAVLRYSHGSAVRELLSQAVQLIWEQNHLT
jgi:hypothetical protein